MRLFSLKENELLRKLVEYKNDTNLQDLQVARLLRKELSFLAIKWEIEPKMNVDLYCVTTNDKKYPLKQLFSVIDFIYFVYELEKIGYIRLLNISSERKEKLRILYDKEKYTFNGEKNQFINTNIDTENDNILSLVGDKDYQLFGKIDNYEYVNQLTKQQFPNSFAKDLDDIVYSIIYPMPILEDYVNNNFKTLEERHHDEEMKVALDSAGESRKAAKIALGSFILSLIVCMIQMCSSQKIDPDQITMIETAIKNNQIEEPLKVEIKDTILTKTIRIFPK